MWDRSDGLEVLVPKRGMVPMGNSIMVPLNWTMRVSLAYEVLQA